MPTVVRGDLVCRELRSCPCQNVFSSDGDSVVLREREKTLTLILGTVTKKILKRLRVKMARGQLVRPAAPW